MTLLEVLTLALTLAVFSLAYVLLMRHRSEQVAPAPPPDTTQPPRPPQQPEMSIMRGLPVRNQPDERILKIEEELDVLYDEIDNGKVKDWEKRESELVRQMVTIFMNETDKEQLYDIKSHISGSN